MKSNNKSTKSYERSAKSAKPTHTITRRPVSPASSVKSARPGHISSQYGTVIRTTPHDQASSNPPETTASASSSGNSASRKIIPIIVILVGLLIGAAAVYIGIEKFNLFHLKSSSHLTIQGNVVTPEQTADDTSIAEFQSIADENADSYSKAVKRAEEQGLPAPPNININDWQYILVNGDHKIDSSFVPETGTVYSLSSASEQDVRIIDDMTAFVENAEAQGLDVYLASGYRSYEIQEVLFENKCSEYDYETAATIVAIPGTSEHQTGLCCDITDYDREYKNEELEYTDTYQWMSKHCQDYGFIVRFPKDKKDITKIMYEPWHFRYVGKEAATYIMENGLCLEEFWALYTDS